MKLVIQRVKFANLKVDNKEIAKIENGLVCFVGFTESDEHINFSKPINKLVGLRIFEDEFGKMNINVSKVNGQILIVPNFTLYADCSEGFRPSFIKAMTPEKAKACFNKFVEQTKNAYSKTFSGIFGADMQINQLNDGPITIIMEF